MNTRSRFRKLVASCFCLVALAAAIPGSVYAQEVHCVYTPITGLETEGVHQCYGPPTEAEQNAYQQYLAYRSDYWHCVLIATATRGIGYVFGGAFGVAGLMMTAFGCVAGLGMM